MTELLLTGISAAWLGILTSISPCPLATNIAAISFTVQKALQCTTITTMSWTIIYFKKVFFVTRKMEVKFIKPILVEKPLTVRGRLSDSPDDHTIKARAEILNDEGNVVARSIGEFVVLQEEKLSSVPEDMKKEMSALSEKFTPSQ